jgi:hypothetical protein
VPKLLHPPVHRAIVHRRQRAGTGDELMVTRTRVLGNVTVDSPDYEFGNKYVDDALVVADMAVAPGEDGAFDMQWGGLKAKSVSLTADGQIGAASAGYYLGYLVTAALSAAVINVRDAIAAGAGTIVDIIPASAAAGVQVNLPYAKYCPTGVYADFAGTGTVTFFYWQP